ERRAQDAMVTALRATLWALIYWARNGYGAMVAMPESRKRSPRACHNQNNIAARCPRWVGHNLRPTRYRRSLRMCGASAIAHRPSGINRLMSALIGRSNLRDSAELDLRSCARPLSE